MKNKFVDIFVSVIRVYLGVWFFQHGLFKFMFHTETWKFLGSSMQNIGISFYPEFWGFMAVITFTFGGFFLALGVCTKIASLMLGFTMLIAFILHQVNGDGVVQLSLLYLIIFILFIILGSGTYTIKSIMALIKKK